jgi:hypothetical protein
MVTTLPRRMTRFPLSLPLLAAVLAVAGCGGAYDPRADLPTTVSKDDQRAVALNCLTRHEGLDARLDGKDAIVVGAGDRGPRVRFFLTGGESEAAQFEGRAEGSEQIGSALLFVRDGSDDELEQVEFCLDHL